MKNRAKQSCSICHRIRWFMIFGLLLNAGVFLQPTWAQALAAYMPSSMLIGLAIVLIGSVGFAIRYWQHRN